MRVRPTELGWKGLALLAALQLAFLATSYSNPFFLVIVFCCALGGLGLVQAVMNLRRVAVTRCEVPMAAAGETRALRVELLARKRHWDVAVELSVDDEVVAVADAAAIDGVVALAGTLPPRARGVRAVRAVRLCSRFPFGFFAVSRAIPVAATIVTYPDPLPARARYDDRGSDSGDASSRGVHGTMVAGLRQFRTGDALRDVHWRATARRGTAIVKEREPEQERAHTVVLDRRCTSEALELALSTVADLVLGAREAKATLHVLSQDAAFTIGHDRNDADAALRWLAAASPLPADAAPPPRVAHATLLPAHAARGKP